MIDILLVLADNNDRLFGRKVRPFSLVWFVLMGLRIGAILAGLAICYFAIYGFAVMLSA